MRLSAITVQNYRCFPDLTTLEMRPLTLLYGWNNSGKSALLRLLPLLGDSVAHGVQGPLNLLSPAARGSGLRDILWKGKPLNLAEKPLLLAFDFDGAPLRRIEYQLKIEEYAHVRSLRTEAAEGQEDLAMTRELAPGESLPFPGLVPGEDTEEPVFQQIRAQMLLLRDAVHWLGSVREVKRTYQAGRTPPLRLGPTGEEAPDVLRARPELRAAVSRWYEARTGRGIHFEDLGSSDYRVLLRRDDAPHMNVALADSGEGMVQLLPVLTTIEMALAGEGPRFVAIEEVESHLHPNAQRELGSRLCEASALKGAPTFLIETHSHVLLLEVQRQIASRGLRPEQVLVYWMDQEADGRGRPRAVTFDERGVPQQSWLGGAFAEVRALSRELLVEQQKSPRNAG